MKIKLHFHSCVAGGLTYHLRLLVFYSTSRHIWAQISRPGLDCIPRLLHASQHRSNTLTCLPILLPQQESSARLFTSGPWPSTVQLPLSHSIHLSQLYEHSSASPDVNSASPRNSPAFPATVQPRVLTPVASYCTRVQCRSSTQNKPAT
mgnify:CR=1 FL=1